MPSLDLDDNQAAYQVRAYKPGLIQVNEKIFTQSLIITPDRLIEDWPPQTVDMLTLESLALVIPLRPTILLIGTGTTSIFLPHSLYGHLINEGIGVEIMDTSAACRTYNVLTAENRKVAAALIIR